MNEMYLKMILALPDEFFDGWEWQAGDKALSINDQYKRELLLLTTAPLEKLNYNDNVTLLFPHSVDGVTVEEYIFNLRPIPRQEQLQKIAKKLLENEAKREVTNLELLKEFYYFCGDHCAPEYKDETFGCLWMQFIVMHRDNKLWIEGNWV